MKKFKELTEGMNKKVPVYHADRKTLVGHVSSSATSIGAAKLAKKKSAAFTKVDGKYGWVASDNLKESKYGDAMTSRLPAHLPDPRLAHLDADDKVEKSWEKAEKARGKKLAAKRNPKDHSWKLFREEAALDAALDGIYILIAEELTPREKKSGAERLADKPEPPLDHALEHKKELEKVKQAKETTTVTLHEDYKVGDKVVAKIGPHKGQVHTVIHVHPTGHLNIKPEVHVSRNKYHLGAAKADPKDVDRAPIHEGKKIEVKGKKKFVPDPKIWKKMPGLSKLLGVKLGESTGINRQTVQEVFAAAKDKKKVEHLQGDEADDQKEVVPQNSELVTQDGGEPKPEKKDNRLKPENAGKSKKLQVKGPGPEDKFQTDPIVTPLTTMPDTASPKSGSQGVR